MILLMRLLSWEDVQESNKKKNEKIIGFQPVYADLESAMEDCPDGPFIRITPGEKGAKH